MTRYFYTDPLSAAWMAKHFGMVFFTPEDDEFQEEIYADGNVSTAFEAHGADRVYVHPDSLPLLEPRLNDFVTNTHDDHNRKHRACSGFVIGFLNDGRDAYVDKGERHNGKSAFCEQVIGLRVIQRDAKAFMWPESEAA